MADPPDFTTARRVMLADMILTMPNHDMMVPPDSEDDTQHVNFAKRTIPHLYNR